MHNSRVYNCNVSSRPNIIYENRKDLTQNEFRVLILGDGTMIMFSSFLSFAVLPTEHFLYKNGPITSIPRLIQTRVHYDRPQYVVGK